MKRLAAPILLIFAIAWVPTPGRWRAAERQAFEAAVEYYAAGWSRKTLVFDAPLPAIGGALERADNAPSLAGVSIDSAHARVLESAASAYRKAWWPSHQRANIEALNALQPLVDRHGPAVLSFITQKYGLPWPSDGYPIHFSGYSNWSGAYSTDGNLLVISSRASYSRNVSGLEIMFHESMHQWDDTVFKLLRTHARALGGLVPGDLSHAMIFYTAGEAVRREVPGHTPYGELLVSGIAGCVPFGRR